MASGISSVAMLSTFIGLPVSIPLGGISLAGASVGGMAMVLTKKYQKKLTKVTKLVDIITSALAVFETSISKALNDGKVDEQKFGMLETLHLIALNELACYHSTKNGKLQSIYYQLSHLWKGHKAIRKATELRKEKLKVIKQWLFKQAFSQVH